MTGRLAICILAVAGVPSLFGQGVHPTAAFTLDVERERFFSGTPTPMHVQFDDWVRRCRIVAGGALYVLECPSAEARVRSFTGDRAPESVDVSIALFRDLDEGIYLAGCPSVEELKRMDERGKEPSGQPLDQKSDAEQEEKKGAEATLRDCRDVAQGETFSVEVEDEELRIVIRGRQLPFTIFGFHPKDKPIGTYDEPVITTSAPRIGPRARVSESGVPRVEPSLWHLPPAKAVERSARLTPRDEPLRTGRFVVDCATPMPVYVDTAYMGVCPLAMPLIAGPHTLQVKRREQADWQREFRLEAGKTVEFRVPAAR